jgi:hypothetical protein
MATPNRRSTHDPDKKYRDQYYTILSDLDDWLRHKQWPEQAKDDPLAPWPGGHKGGPGGVAHFSEESRRGGGPIRYGEGPKLTNKQRKDIMWEEYLQRNEDVIGMSRNEQDKFREHFNYSVPISDLLPLDNLGNYTGPVGPPKDYLGTKSSLPKPSMGRAVYGVDPSKPIYPSSTLPTGPIPLPGAATPSTAPLPPSGSRVTPVRTPTPTPTPTTPFTPTPGLHPGVTRPAPTPTPTPTTRPAPTPTPTPTPTTPPASTTGPLRMDPAAARASRRLRSRSATGMMLTAGDMGKIYSDDLRAANKAIDKNSSDAGAYADRASALWRDSKDYVQSHGGLKKLLNNAGPSDVEILRTLRDNMQQVSHDYGQATKFDAKTFPLETVTAAAKKSNTAYKRIDKALQRLR